MKKELTSKLTAQETKRLAAYYKNNEFFQKLPITFLKLRNSTYVVNEKRFMFKIEKTEVK